MIIEKENVRPGEPPLKLDKERAAQLLNAQPSGPHFTRSTITYCNEGVEIAAKVYEEILTRQHPGLSDKISQKIQEIGTEYIPLPASDLSAEEGKIYLTIPTGKKIPAKEVVESIYHANPHLGPFYYAIALYPPINNKEAYMRFPGFNLRLRNIVEAGNLPLNSPIAEIMAVAYITQVAKIFAVTEVKALMRRVAQFGGMLEQARLNEYLDKTLGAPIRQIKRHEAFIASGLKTISEIADRANLTADQTQFLLNLAFIKSAALDLPEGFREALAPIVRLVVEGRWQEALLHHDFLLKYFSKAFPDWRVVRFEQERGLSFGNLKQLAEAVRNGQVVINPEDIPSQYREIFNLTLGKRVERAQREKEQEIIHQSGPLSNTLIRELDQAIPQKPLYDIFGKNIPTGLLEFRLTDSEVDNINNFQRLVMSARKRLGYAKAYAIYRTLRPYFEKVTSISHPPYVLHLPTLKKVFEVEVYDDHQIYWYQSEHSVDIVYKGRSILASGKNFANFGRLLHDLILVSFQANPERPVLGRDEIKKAMQRAYEAQKRLHPERTNFKLSEYVLALINKASLNFKLAKEDPVRQFIDQLDD